MDAFKKDTSTLHFSDFSATMMTWAERHFVIKCLLFGSCSFITLTRMIEMNEQMNS